MISALYPALSALRAFGEKLGVTSNNIANINTNGFKKSRAILEETGSSGVTVSISRVNTPGDPLPVDGDTGKPQESSNVDVGEEMVSWSRLSITLYLPNGLPRWWVGESSVMYTKNPGPKSRVIRLRGTSTVKAWASNPALPPNR